MTWKKLWGSEDQFLGSAFFSVLVARDARAMETILIESFSGGESDR